MYLLNKDTNRVVGIIIVVLILLSQSCSNGDYRRPASYIGLDGTQQWSSNAPAVLNLCFEKGKQSKNLYLSVRYDHRVSDSLLGLEVRLERWGLRWGSDTIMFNLAKPYLDYKQRRPSTYELEEQTAWRVAPPIAGVYQVVIYPLKPIAPTGIVALGLRSEE